MAKAVSAPEEPPLVRLDQAFRWVLACFEEVEAVPRAQRGGLFPGEDDPFEASDASETSSARYRRWADERPADMPAIMHKRGPSAGDIYVPLSGVERPPTPCQLKSFRYVPLVPNATELIQLMEKYEFLQWVRSLVDVMDKQLRKMGFRNLEELMQDVEYFKPYQILRELGFESDGDLMEHHGSKDLHEYLRDSQRSGDASTEPERRLAEVHRWLVGVLLSGVVQGWADQKLSPDGGGGDITIEKARRIEPAWWELMVLDYCGAKAWWPSGDPLQQNAVAPVLGVAVKGDRWLTNIALNRSQLREALVARSRPEAPASVRIGTLILKTSDDGHDTCEIRCGDQSTEIELHHREKVARGIRALIVLLRNQGTPVASHLLYCLGSRGTHTRGSKEDAKSRQDLRQKVLPISQKLLHGSITPDEAHRELIEVIEKIEGPSIRNRAAWSPEFVENRPRSGKNLTKSYGRICADMKKTLSVTIAAIRARFEGDPDALGAVDKLVDRLQPKGDVVSIARTTTGEEWTVELPLGGEP